MNQRSCSTLVACAVPIVFSLAASPAFGELLLNPNFDTPTPGLVPPNYPNSISGFHAEDVASADHWRLFNNTVATTSSELLPSTYPSGGGYMIHVTTDGAINGIYQFVSMVPGATASVDVFVLSGTATLFQFTNHGETELGATSSTIIGQWQTLTLTVNSGDPNEFVLYSSTAGAANFYADNAHFFAIPEPPSSSVFAIATAGGLAYGFRNRQVRRRQRSLELSDATN